VSTLIPPSFLPSIPHSRTTPSHDRNPLFGANDSTGKDKYSQGSLSPDTKSGVSTPLEHWDVNDFFTLEDDFKNHEFFNPTPPRHLSPDIELFPGINLEAKDHYFSRVATSTRSSSPEAIWPHKPNSRKRKASDDEDTRSTRSRRSVSSEAFLETFEDLGKTPFSNSKLHSLRNSPEPKILLNYADDLDGKPYFRDLGNGFKVVAILDEKGHHSRCGVVRIPKQSAMSQLEIMSQQDEPISPITTNFAKFLKKLYDVRNQNEGWLRLSPKTNIELSKSTTIKFDDVLEFRYRKTKIKNKATTIKEYRLKKKPQHINPFKNPFPISYEAMGYPET
jgi:hypothetical protein